jgi:hypothetical protein
MEVGVNYPWFDYGWDFGVAPPKWRRDDDVPNWVRRVRAQLHHFAGIGITVIRWFVLGDGLTYGMGADAPKLDKGARQGDVWRFAPPILSDEVQEHFDALLQQFDQVNKQVPRPIRLLPVLIDFKFCDPGIYIVGEDPNRQQSVPDEDWVKQGRADAIIRSPSQFIIRVLQPLLQLSRAHADTIYAWDLINEPEWITNNWHLDRHTQGRLPVDESSMRDFLEDGKSAIRQAGFKCTIGFRSIETIRRTRIFADINQFHHYRDFDPALQQNPFVDRRYPGIIGEFATSANQDTWQELRQRGLSQRVLERLKFAQRQRYELAIAWSFTNPDSRSSWNVQVENDIECFTQGRNCR